MNNKIIVTLLFTLLALLTVNAHSQGMDFGSTERSGCEHMTLEEDDLIVSLNNSNDHVKVLSTAQSVHVSLWDSMSDDWAEVSAKETLKEEIDLGKGKNLIGKTVAIATDQNRPMELLHIQQEENKPVVQHQNTEKVRYVHFVGSDGSCLPK